MEIWANFPALYRMIAKQRAKTEQTRHVCLLAVEKYEKVNTKNDYETISKQTKQYTNLKRNQTCSVGFVKVFKFQENKFKIVQKNF